MNAENRKKMQNSCMHMKLFAEDGSNGKLISNENG